MRQASRKVPDGKMVELGIQVEEGKVVNAQIRGDFFLQPPVKLQELEKRLEGLSEADRKEDIVKELRKVDAELIGFSRTDIAEAFLEAAGDEE